MRFELSGFVGAIVALSNYRYLFKIVSTKWSPVKHIRRLVPARGPLFPGPTRARPRPYQRIFRESIELGMLSLRSSTVHSFRRLSPSAKLGIRRSLQLSAVEGPLEPPLVNATLGEYFETHILSQHGARPALICRNERFHGGWNLRYRPNSQNHYLVWDFNEFGWHIDAVVRGLLDMGVKKGDRVGILMGNNRFDH